MMKNFSTSSFVAGVMLGLLLAGAWIVSTDSSLLLPSLSASSTNNREEQTPESGAISVADQKAGPEVTVESVTVTPPGVWVAVREVSGNALGNVLGAVRVSGPRTDVIVSLLRPTEPSRSYAVELYRDDSGGSFDVATNSVYVDFDTGAPVIARFKTTE